MMTSFRAAAAVCSTVSILLCGGLGGAALAGPSMAVKASPNKMNLEACKKRAQEVFKKASFRVSRVLAFSVFGEQGDYSVIVRCAPEQGVVFFAASGPRMERASQFVDEVGDNF